MTSTFNRLPPSLQNYCSKHDPSKYTARDHAAWRYIMRRSHDFFKDHAVSSYQKGFEQSGLTVDHIPDIDDIDRKLQDFGWGAVPVVGFIPPWAFIEFQARKILPIATDMRSVEHIAYTPAPDIVHEAAGHAPIIPDQDYSNYLAYYASLGTKALYSRQDLRMYEAIRYLSDVKEKHNVTAAVIADAEQRLKDTSAAFNFVSEQALVARMSWWTAEYGMVGSLKNPKIYGAGLLSSVSESKLAMTDRVKKLPFSLDCIQYAYDITEPQPQLFVADNMQHLQDVLHELDAKLAYRIGGVPSLEKAVACQAISSLVLDTGVTVSGQLECFEHQGDRVDFIKFSGPSQISRAQRQLAGHGIDRHGQGFSSPLGRLEGFAHKAFSDLTPQELEHLNLVPGRTTRLRFLSGFEVTGRVLSLYKPETKILLISFNDCTVRQGSRVTFEPSWGEFDMVLGDKIPSVYGGPADRDAFGEQEIADTTTTPGRETPFTEKEQKLFGYYRSVSDLRSALKAGLSPPTEMQRKLQQLAHQIDQDGADEWLLLLELLELAKTSLTGEDLNHPWLLKVQETLNQTLVKGSADTRELLSEGMRLIS